MRPSFRVSSRGRFALAAFSGILLILSFPKFGNSLVAWVALVPLLVALSGVPPRRAALLAYLSGFVSSLGLLYWISLVVVQFGGLSLPAGILVMALLCLAFSLFTAGFGLLLALFGRRWGEGSLLLAPVPWVAFEILRGHVLLRFPWCLLGYSQFQNLPAIQIASYTAVYGVSFLLVASSAALSYALVVPSPRRRLGALLGLVGLLGAALVHGSLALRSTLSRDGSLRVGLIQANIPQEEKWDREKGLRNMERHEALTRQAARAGAELVVWPESALPFYYDTSPEVAQELRDLVSSLGIDLLFGNDDTDLDPTGRERFFVGAKMLDRKGALSLRYHKIRLVPFGEYVPWKSLLEKRGVGKLVAQVSDFTPGDRFSLGTLAGHPIGAFICYEAIFPDLVREFPNGGAELLVNITNDAWYGSTSAPYQHFAMAVFRAVENRKYVARAANTGITAVVDPFGRIHGATRLFEPAVLVEDVSFVPGATFYSRHGDLFAWGCLALTALLTLVSAPRRGTVR
jgi:apolipoprotein N-acyltransferase